MARPKPNIEASNIPKKSTNSKHGRTKELSPKWILDTFLDYVEWSTKNPIYITKLLSNGNLVEVPNVRPISINAFKLYINEHHNISFAQYIYRELHEDYHEVIEYIKIYCSNHLIERAIIGMYHPTIVSKLVGLVDRVETTNTVKTIEVRYEESEKPQQSIDE
jgi:hypothetical protein